MVQDKDNCSVNQQETKGKRIITHSGKTNPAKQRKEERNKWSYMMERRLRAVRKPKCSGLGNEDR